MADEKTLITSEQRELIEQIRTELGPKLAKYYDTDFNLLRWVRGWDGNLSEILPRITSHMQIRKALHFNMENFLENSENPHLYIMEKANNYLPQCGAKNCFDKHGNVIHIIRLGTIDQEKCLQHIRMSDMLIHQLICAEANLRAVAKQEKKLGHLCGMTIIYDMEGIEMTGVLMDTLNGSVPKVMQVVQDNYPETTQKMLAVNCPPWAQFGWGIVKMFMSQKTQEKVHILSNDWKTEILEFIDPENLPVAYGGELRLPVDSEFDPETCCRDPDPWPEDYMQLLPQLPNLERLETIFVKAYEPFTVEVEIKKENSIITWYFKADGDIEFAIYLGDDMMEPLLPLATRHVPEYGDHQCKQTGTYRVVFKPYAWLLSTKLEYTVYMVEPEN